MDTSRVSFGEMVAAAGGAALLVCMFLPWFGGRFAGRAPIRVPSKTGWESFATLWKFLLAAAALVVIAVAVAHAMDAALPALGFEQGTLVQIAGVVAFVIVAIRIVDPPGLVPGVAIPGLEVDVSRRIAAFLALAAAGVMTYGGLLQRRERLG
jgi:hypothetical protein